MLNTTHFLVSPETTLPQARCFLRPSAHAHFPQPLDLRSLARDAPLRAVARNLISPLTSTAVWRLYVYSTGVSILALSTANSAANSTLLLHTPYAIRCRVEQQVQSGRKYGAVNLIAGITPTGGEFQNPRSRNLLQPNESTPTPKRYKQGGGVHSYVAETNSVNAGFGIPPPWG